MNKVGASSFNQQTMKKQKVNPGLQTNQHRYQLSSGNINNQNRHLGLNKNKLNNLNQMQSSYNSKEFIRADHNANKILGNSKLHNNVHNMLNLYQTREAHNNGMGPQGNKKVDVRYNI